jgi:hypothetical protein
MKAEDFEAAIVIGWHKITGQELNLCKINGNPSEAGISKKVYRQLLSQPEYIDVGMKIATDIQKHFKLGNDAKALQYGRSKSNTITEFWKGHGAKNKTPKTDIIIGDKKLSLKIGMAQLMSGGKAEATATLYAALDKSMIGKSTQVNRVTNIFEDFVTSSLCRGKIRPIIKSGRNQLVNRGERAHKEMMRELGVLFEENEKFKIEFVREAMSGIMKYGENSNASAEFVVSANHNGLDTNVISVYDDEYCKKIADNMKLQARFKTSGRVLMGEKTGEYNYWSVVSLIVDSTMKEAA